MIWWRRRFAKDFVSVWLVLGVFWILHKLRFCKSEAVSYLSVSEFTHIFCSRGSLSYCHFVGESMIFVIGHWQRRLENICAVWLENLFHSIRKNWLNTMNCIFVHYYSWLVFAYSNVDLYKKWDMFLVVRVDSYLILLLELFLKFQIFNIFKFLEVGNLLCVVKSRH